MNHLKPFAIILLLILAIISSIVSAQDEAQSSLTMDSIERSLELSSHQQLLSRIAEDNTLLNDFTTDGCSGGLSSVWSQLSVRFPDLARVHGDLPPWQSCCISHDRQYHQGGLGANSADLSFDQRKAADLTLKACVIETGLQRSAILQTDYDLSAEQIAGLYSLIAEAMYHAVRLGGIPCTSYSWRWGYGWPRCQ